MIAALRSSLVKVILVLFAAILVVASISLGIFSSSSSNSVKAEVGRAKTVNNSNPKPGANSGPTTKSISLATYLVGKDGSIFALGGSHFFGSAAGKNVGSRVTGAAVAGAGDGYWLVTSKGHVYNFGNAKSLGSATSVSSPIVGIASDPSGDGYWLVTSKGHVYNFGNAKSLGSLNESSLAGPIVGIAALSAGSKPTGARQLLRINLSQLPSGLVGNYYSVSLTATGGVAPYSWRIISGAIPQGLSFNSNGTMQGVPSAIAALPLTIGVSDSDGGKATNTFNLVIGPATPPVSTPPQPEKGNLSVAIDQLPAGISGSVTVNGPNGYSAVIGASSVLSVQPGTYSVTALDVSDSIYTYYPTVSPASVTVEAGTVSVVGVSYFTAIYNTTTVLQASDMADLQSASPNGSSLLFSPIPTALEGLAVGDVIVSGPSSKAPAGFLKKVTDVASYGNTMAISTKPTTLSDAIARASFSADWPTSPMSQVQASRMIASARVAGVRAETSPSPQTKGGAPSFLPGKFQCGENIPVSVSFSNIQFSITPHLDASWSLTGGVSADAYVTVVESLGASASIGGGIYCQDTIPLWGPQTFGIPDINFSVGPVPVNISILMEIDATLKAEVDDTFSTTVKQGFTLEAGASYSGGQLTPINSFSPNFSMSTPKNGISGYLKASIGPKVTFAFYCYDICFTEGNLPALTPLVGPTVGIDGYLKFLLQGTSQPAWDLSAGVEATIGFNLKVAGIIHLNAQLTIPVWQTVLAASPPVITTSPTLASVDTGKLTTAYSLQLQASGYTGTPSGSQPILWNLTSVSPAVQGVGISSSGVLTLPQLDDSLANQTLAIQATAVDPLGNTTTQTFDIDVLPGPKQLNFELPQAEVGLEYYYAVPVYLSGSASSYTCSGPNGPAFDLGVGLNINSDCSITGTPSSDAYDSVYSTGVVQSMNVTDPNGGLANDTLTMGPVFSATVLYPIGGDQSNPITGEVGVPFSFTAQAALGDPPYDYDMGTCNPFSLSTNVPPGLTWNSATAQLTGIPTTWGQFQVPIMVRDNLEACYSYVAYITISSGPALTNNYLPSGDAGNYLQGQLFATGGHGPYQYTVTSVQQTSANNDLSCVDSNNQPCQSALPQGLTLDPNSGILSGVPTAGDEGTYSLTIKATDSLGSSVSKVLSLSLYPKLSITTPMNLPPAPFGQYYKEPLQASGGVGNYSWFLGSLQSPGANLPAGLFFDASGAITRSAATFYGTPAPWATTSFFQVTLHDQSTNGYATSWVLLPVGITIVTSSVPVAEVNSPYATEIRATGGVGTYRWSAFDLPAGISIKQLDATDAGLIGTPTRAGNYLIKVRATDANGSWISMYRLKVTLPPHPGGTLLGADSGIPYQSNAPLVYGVGPFHWALVQGYALPAGLNLSGAGEITGTTSQIGESVVKLVVTDNYHVSAIGIYDLTVSAAPQVTSTILPSATVGKYYQYTLGESGGTPLDTGKYFWTIAQQNGQYTELPQGLSLDSTGAVTGTPGTIYGYPTETSVQADQPPKTPGLNFYRNICGYSIKGLTQCVQSFSVQVQDYYQISAPQSLSITVVSPLSFNTTSLETGEVGVGYASELNITGGQAPYKVEATGLPSGLGVSQDASGNWWITGTPTTSFSSTDPLSVCATDQAQNSSCNPGSLGLTIYPAMVISSAKLPVEQRDQSYLAQLKVSGGSGNYRWSQYYGSPIPGWLILSPGGLLSSRGLMRPPAYRNSWTFPITVRDGLATKVIDFTLDVAGSAAVPPPPTSLTITPTGLTITPTSLANAMTNKPYQVQFSASGGVSPEQWSATGLPGWLTMSSTGLLSGTPTIVPDQQPSFSVTVSDSSTPALTATETIGLSVVRPIRIVTSSPITNASVGSFYQDQLVANGGLTPYSWSATGLPSWLKLSSTGMLSGTAIQSGSVSFNVALSDSGNPTQSASEQLSLTVQPAALAITTTSPLPNATTLGSYADQLTASGGTAPYSWSGSGLPSWLSLSSGGSLSGTVPSTGATYTFAVTVTDSAIPAQSVSANLSLTSAAPSSSYTWNAVTAVEDSNGTLTDALAVGKGGAIERYSSLPSSWTSIASGTSNDLFAVTSSGNDVWAVGDGGTILNSTDSGKTWSSQSVSSQISQICNPYPTCNYLQGVAFSNQNNGIIVGTNETILTTSDGGATWNYVQGQEPFVAITGAIYSLNGVVFDSNGNAYAVGTNSGTGTDATILYRPSGSTSWTTQTSNVGSGYGLRTVGYAAPYVIAAGQGGTIDVLDTSSTSPTWTVQSDPISNSSSITLSGIGIGGYCLDGGIGQCVAIAGSGGNLLGLGSTGSNGSLNFVSLTSGTSNDLGSTAVIGAGTYRYVAVGSNDTKVFVAAY